MEKNKLTIGNKTLIMGILNVTPDSFSDGGLYFPTVEKAVARAEDMVQEGADIIDIGGESTRPGAQSVSATEELQRIIPVISILKHTLPPNILLSIDTYKSPVARAALIKGVHLINSLGGALFDSTMYAVAKEYSCPIIIYHIKGKPRTMQQGEIAYTDVIGDIADFFKTQMALGKTMGVKKEQFLIDPGIGFGKNVSQNLDIIRRLQELSSLNAPIVIGVSRKSHLGFILKEALSLSEMPPPTERLEASLAETALAVWNGARIIRTHDVLATKKCIAVVDAIKDIS